MKSKAKLVNLGNKTGVSLPREAVNRLGWEAGQDVVLVETDGGFEISSPTSESSTAQEIAEDVMKRRHDVLSRLAE